MTGHRRGVLSLLSVNGVKSVVPDLLRAFEQAGGAPAAPRFDEAGLLRRAIEAGEPFDVAILPRPAIGALAAAGRITHGADFARAEFGLGRRREGPKPDTTSRDALRRLLLGARGVVYTDPATGGVSGVFFTRILTALGIADAVKDKGILTAGVLNAERIAAGDADIAVQMRHELLAVPGIEFLPFPAEFAKDASVVFTIGLCPTAPQPEAARGLAAFLTGPAAAPLLHAKGLEPG